MPYRVLCFASLWLVCLHAASAADLPKLARALWWQPYTFSDASTLALLHLDERSQQAPELGGLEVPDEPKATTDVLTAEPAGGGAAAGSGAQRARNAVTAGAAARLAGAVDLVAAGRFGGGLHLRGGDGRLIFPDAGRLSARTLECWVRLDELPAQPATLFYCYAEAMRTPEYGLAQPVVLRLTPAGALEVIWQGAVVGSSTSKLTAGQWAHVALAYGLDFPYEQQGMLFVNGREEWRAKLPKWQGENTFGGFVVGNDLAGHSGCKALVDEVRFSKAFVGFYTYDLDWPQPARALAPPAGQPYFRDAADLLFHLNGDRTLTPVQAAPGTTGPTYRPPPGGDADPQRFVPGVAGEAMVHGAGGTNPVFQGAGNLDPHHGTIAFWMRPLDWDNLTRSNRISGPPGLSFGLFQIDGEYAEGSYKRNFGKVGPLLEFNVELRLDDGTVNPLALTPGAWTHLAITWDGINFRYFVNGQLRANVGEWALWLPIYPNEDPGRNPAQPDWWLKAKPSTVRFGDRTYWDQLKLPTPRTAIDDFRIYRRVLAPVEIANLSRWYDPRAKTAPLPPADLAFTYNGVDGWVKAAVVPLLPDYAKAASVRVGVTAAGADKPLASSTVALDEQRQAVVTVTTPPLAFGAFSVSAEVLDAGGAVLGHSDGNFARRAPPWWQSQAGRADTVLPGWTPVTVSGDTIHVVGRELKIAPSGLLASVVSQGAEVLAGPVTVAATVAGQPVAWTPAAAPTLAAPSPTHATASGQLSAAGLTLTTTSTTEFDGLMWVTCTLAPAAGQTPALERLTLRLPYHADSASLVHWWTGAQDFRHPGSYLIGAVPPGEGVVLSSTDPKRWLRPPMLKGNFVPYVALTGMQRGLVWCAESDQGWTQSDTVPAVSLERQGEVVTLVLNVIAAPLKLDAPRTFAFGLQAIPVKPLEPNWRRRAPSYTNVYPDTFMGNNLKGPSGPTTFDVMPANEDWEAVRRRINGEDGTRGAPTMKGKYEGAIAAFKQQYHRDPLPIELVAPGLYWDLHWGNGWGEHTREWAESWFSGGEGEYTPSFLDAHAWAWEQWLTQTKGFLQGVYMDDCWNLPDMNPRGGVSYLLPDGTRQPGWLLRGYRERQLRMRRITEEHGLPPHFTAHSTHTMYLPYHTFYDLVVDGEDFYSVPPAQHDFMDHWPLDRMRYMNSAKWGLMISWLGWAGNSLKPDKWPAWSFRQGRAYTANLALHDLGWGFDPKVMADFGLNEPDVRFIGYWEPKSPVQCAAPTVQPAVWTRGGQALVLLVNTGNERVAAAACRLDTAALGLGPGALTVQDVDPSLLSYFKDDATTVKQEGADTIKEIKTKAPDEDLGLDEKADDQPLAKRRAADPDGKYEWQPGAPTGGTATLTAPVRRHDYRLFLIGPAK